MSIYLSDMGIVCSLGFGKADVARALFDANRGETMTPYGLMTKDHVPVGAVKQDLPELPEEFKAFNSRNNRMLYQALQDMQGSVAEAIKKFGTHRIGVVMASSTSGMYEEEMAFKHQFKTGQIPEGYSYEQYEMSSASEFTAQYFGLKGPAFTISTACSSGGKAMASARRLILAGICDVVIAGGVDTLCDLTLNGFHSLELLSKNTCNPFGDKRDGINIGEGAAVFLVSAEASAIELAGCGESSDAYHISCPEPTGAGAEVAIREALTMAGLQARDICYINLHGTGTALNDEMESLSVNRIFGDKLPCSSTKAFTGHALGASASLEAGFLWLALSAEDQGKIPVPAHGGKGPADPKLVPIHLTAENTRVDPIGDVFAVMSNSFAFGGSNVSLILRKNARPNYAVADLLPHDAPMVLVDHVLEFNEGYIHGMLTIREDSPFCENGAVPAYVAIEYMAQTVGVWSGLMARKRNQTPKIGFLLGSRRFELHVPEFPVGKELHVFGKPLYIDGEMASFECWIEMDQNRAVQAGLNVYQPKDVDHFLGVLNHGTK